MRNKIEKIAYIAGRMGIPVNLAKDFDKFRELGGDASQLPRVAKDMYGHYMRLWNELIKKEKPTKKAEKVGNTRLVINDVIFSGPATVVQWADGSKTVVKAQNGEKMDAEKGLAMAVVKKLYGDGGKYYDLFKKFCADQYKEECVCNEGCKCEDTKTEAKPETEPEVVCKDGVCEVKKTKTTKAKAK